MGSREVSSAFGHSEVTWEWLTAVNPAHCFYHPASPPSYQTGRKGIGPGTTALDHGSESTTLVQSPASLHSEGHSEAGQKEALDWALPLLCGMTLGMSLVCLPVKSYFHQLYPQHYWLHKPEKNKSTPCHLHQGAALPQGLLHQVPKPSPRALNK